MTDEQALRNIARNLRRFRGDLSFSEIARRVGTYPASIKRIEDEVNMPGVGLLTRLADSLGVSITDMLADPKKNIRNSA